MRRQLLISGIGACLICAIATGCQTCDKHNASNTVTIEYGPRHIGSLFGKDKQDEAPGITIHAPVDATYYVKKLDDRIVFLGIDQPQIIDEQAADQFSIHPKSGQPSNDSKFRRALTERDLAFQELKPLIEEADTWTLLNSLRDGYTGYVDYFVSRDGNTLIGKELYRRMPIDPKLLNRFNKRGIDIWGGDSGPGFSSIRSFIEFHNPNR